MQIIRTKVKEKKALFDSWKHLSPELSLEGELVKKHFKTVTIDDDEVKVLYGVTVKPIRGCSYFIEVNEPALEPKVIGTVEGKTYKWVYKVKKSSYGSIKMTLKAFYKADTKDTPGTAKFRGKITKVVSPEEVSFSILTVLIEAPKGLGFPDYEVTLRQRVKLDYQRNKEYIFTVYPVRSWEVINENFELVEDQYVKDGVYKTRWYTFLEVTEIE